MKRHDNLDRRLRTLEKAFETIQIGVTVTDIESRIIYVNPADARMHGYAVEELLGQDVGIYAPPEKRKKLSAEVFKDLRSWSRESVNLHKDGNSFPVQITSDVVLDSGGKPLALVSSCQDISERKQAEQALSESETRYALAVQGANDGIWDWNLESEEIFFSPRWKAMLGFEEEQIENRPEAWFDRVHPEDRARLRRQLDKHLQGKASHFEVEHRIQHADKRYRWMRTRGLALRDEEGRAVRIAGSQADITGLKVQDPLTGLPNRELLLDHLSLALGRARRRKQLSFAVVFIDFDRFKVINDSLGHLFGDRLLVEVALRLEGTLRPGDTVARYGGDEFCILVEDISEEADSVRVANRILEEFSKPFALEGQEIYMTASLGIVVNSPEYSEPSELLRDADLAMYRAKALGGGRYQVFDSEIRRYAIELQQLETDLRRALHHDEFRVHYQSIVELETRKVVGLEALVRWQHPERGLLAPQEFLHVAEETGLIVTIGRWVLSEACRQMMAWRARFEECDHLSLAVNLSARQLGEPGIVDDVREVLERTRLPPSSLNLEITETVLLEQTKEVIERLTALHDLGVKVCLDDFGTGYSSLSYLQDLPIDTLKIDRSFVNRLEKDGRSSKVIGTIFELGDRLSLSVVAEGIESSDQLALLKGLNCELGQGFTFSKPLRASQVIYMLRD